MVSSLPVPAAASILVAEDQTDIRDLLEMNLRNAGYQVTAVADGSTALAQQVAQPRDLLVLDLMMPGLDGLEVCKALRARGSAAPILMLTAKSTELDRVLGLELGADDYLTKPFGSHELLARIRAALRRGVQAGEAGSAVFRSHGLVVDLAARKVTREGQDIHLTPLEYKLLTTMIEHAGKVLTHRQVLERVWGPAHADDPQYLRVYMAQLRRKLEAEPARPRLLKTETGVGYRLEVD